jgi:hypothetical protein
MTTKAESLRRIENSTKALVQSGVLLREAQRLAGIREKHRLEEEYEAEVEAAAKRKASRGY